jgi:hypothetical protein
LIKAELFHAGIHVSRKYLDNLAPLSLNSDDDIAMVLFNKNQRPCVLVVSLPFLYLI